MEPAVVPTSSDGENSVTGDRRTPRGCDAFLSHSSQDRDTARRLEAALEDDGLSIWLDDSEIWLGQLLGPQLQRSILECGSLLLLWSEAAAASRWVNSEWLMALHQQRLILPCVLDATPLPQCLGNTVRLDLGKEGAMASPLFRRAIRDATGVPTRLAPVMRSESDELRRMIRTIAHGQEDMTGALGQSLQAAVDLQRSLDDVMAQARARWPLDPMIVNLDGYHLKNAYMLKHWDAIQAGRAPADELLSRAERRFFETLWIDPMDPSALNGLGSILLFERDLHAAEFFILAAIRAAERKGMCDYPAAQHDLVLVRRYLEA
ncbi:TIR domain-containing protein [Geodermatophilus sp. URMC 63]